jgi:hypothetical protein
MLLYMQTVGKYETDVVTENLSIHTLSTDICSVYRCVLLIICIRM